MSFSGSETLEVLNMYDNEQDDDEDMEDTQSAGGCDDDMSLGVLSQPHRRGGWMAFRGDISFDV